MRLARKYKFFCETNFGNRKDSYQMYLITALYPQPEFLQLFHDQKL
jgi:hypothetical protein